MLITQRLSLNNQGTQNTIAQQINGGGGIACVWERLIINKENFVLFQHFVLVP